MTFIYTPPEPAYFTTKNGRLWTFPDEIDQTGLELRIHTESQLRSEVERVQRETIEACALAAWKFHMDRSKKAGISPAAFEGWSPVEEIRGLLK